LSVLLELRNPCNIEQESRVIRIEKVRLRKQDILAGRVLVPQCWLKRGCPEGKVDHDGGKSVQVGAEIGDHSLGMLVVDVPDVTGLQPPELGHEKSIVIDQA
jgi:hypothetical protein